MFHLVENTVTFNYKEGTKVVRAINSLQFSIGQYAAKINMALFKQIGEDVKSVEAFGRLHVHKNVSDKADVELILKTMIADTQYLIENFGRINHCENKEAVFRDFQEERLLQANDFSNTWTVEELENQYMKLRECLFTPLVTEIDKYTTTLHRFTVGSIVDNIKKVILYHEECRFELEYDNGHEHMHLIFDEHGDIKEVNNLKDVVSAK